MQTPFFYFVFYEISYTFESSKITMKNLTGYLMLLGILIMTFVMVSKIWMISIALIPIQGIIASREKGQLNIIATFVIYTIVEALFALILFGVWMLIKLI
jgi:hypothetical protein